MLTLMQGRHYRGIDRPHALDKTLNKISSNGTRYMRRALCSRSLSLVLSNGTSESVSCVDTFGKTFHEYGVLLYGSNGSRDHRHHSENGTYCSTLPPFPMYLTLILNKTKNCVTEIGHQRTADNDSHLGTDQEKRRMMRNPPYPWAPPPTCRRM